MVAMLVTNLIPISFEFSYMCSCKASSSEIKPRADVKLGSLSKELCGVEFSSVVGNPGRPEWSCFIVKR